jgi:hypothetical protein
LLAASKHTSSGRLAVAGLCLMAQVLGLVHLALVQHATCLEHDALVHAGPVQPASDATADRPAPPAHPRSVERPGPDSAGHADDHCLAAGFRRLDLASLRAQAAVAGAPPEIPLRHRQRDHLPPPAPVALLRLAPKSSPPAPPV